MAMTGRNGSLEMMFYRRLVKKMDIRGDVSTALNDSASACRIKFCGTRWVEMKEVGRTSMNFWCILTEGFHCSCYSYIPTSLALFLVEVPNIISQHITVFTRCC